MTAITIFFWGAFLLSVGLATGTVVYRLRATARARRMESLRSSCILILSDYLSTPLPTTDPASADYRTYIKDIRQALFATAGIAQTEVDHLHLPVMREVKLVILSFLRAVEGEARTRLEELYAACGFADSAIGRLASPVWLDRAYATSELGTARLRFALNPLCDLLQDPNPTVALHAMHAALDIGGAPMIPRIVRLLPAISATEEMYLVDVCMEQGLESAAILLPLLDDPRDDVKRFALNALGAIHAYAETPVIARFLHSTNRTLCVAAMRALGIMGSEEPIGEIACVCEQADTGMKKEAAVALGAIGGVQSADILRRLAGDPDRSVRAAAANALAHIVRQETRHGEDSFHNASIPPRNLYGTEHGV